MTRLHLASWLPRIKLLWEEKPPHILESFYYMRTANKKSVESLMEYVRSEHCKTFILDSGAFTYMESAKKSNKLVNDDFDSYVKEYCAFINKHDVTYFVEMDIDVVVGLKKVEQYRAEIERLTNKKVIPVFHKARGEEYFHQMCRDYDYVAIGGLVVLGGSRKHYKYLEWFIDVAHANNARIHGLGFTSVESLKKFHFDSVDSTSWLAGSKYASVDKWNPITSKMEKINKPAGTRASKGFCAAAEQMSCRSWIRFGKYLERLHKGHVLEWKKLQ